jgi:hypothetical protein
VTTIDLLLEIARGSAVDGSLLDLAARMIEPDLSQQDLLPQL